MKRSLFEERSGYSSMLAVVRPTLMIVKPLLRRKCGPRGGPLVLLTSPRARNANATSPRLYNNTVGLNRLPLLFTFQFSVSVLEGENKKICPCTTRHRLRPVSLKSPSKAGVSQTAPVVETCAVTLEPGAP